MILYTHCWMQGGSRPGGWTYGRPGGWTAGRHLYYQAPFSGTPTRRIGAPGGARVSTDSARAAQTTEITGINRTARTRELASRLGSQPAHPQRARPEKTQVRAYKSALQQLAGHDYALDLVGALVDLGVL
jgi:hypothetical protein